ncbi:MAG: DUF1906 domain-containing protein [Alicyclobacillus macrosporangiidus]|uniref:glycoside hydrolase domain-containing protein n=1 Tax=Alicyclobacillus macrosporangiidus TaxID=392015 RepID=UPI0026F216E1|nr:glycoside hydrolase domain-containing protein [Alicyclobacillus macrosporangiidus]MCL6597921.1 DUF1906 domain-containing protein [Alicyclobacillus macrosporangiidus]
MPKYRYRPVRNRVSNAQAAASNPIFTVYQLSGKPVASKSDIRHLFGPIEDQGPLGSCTAFAACQWLQALRVQAGYPWVELSELAEYYEERAIQGDVKDDTGANNMVATQVLEQYGAMLESDWPYIVSNFAVAPPPKWDEHLKITAATAQVITDDGDAMIMAIKDALTQEHPVMFGWQVFASAESLEVAQTGVLPMPASGEQILGGHETIFVGHDDDITFPQWNGLKGGFLVRNQWGPGWGQQGYFWMPYEYAKQYIDDRPVVGMPLPKVGPSPSPSPAPQSVFAIRAYWGSPDKPVTQYQVNDPSAYVGLITTLNGQPYNSGMSEPMPILYIQHPNGSTENGPCPTVGGGAGAVPWSTDVPGTYYAYGEYQTPTGETIRSEKVACEWVASSPDPSPTPAPQPSPTPPPSPTPTPPTPQPGPTPARCVQAIDCSTRLTASQAAQLRSLGVRAVFRYLGNWSKSLTAAEVQAIHGAGLSILPIWESNPTSASYFTRAQGQQDAQAAAASAQSLGIPKDTTIWYVVDYNAQTGDLPAIDAYVDGLVSANTGYGIGVYGSAAVVAHLQAGGKVQKLWQTYAWSHGRLTSGVAAYQYANEVTLAGVSVDLNVIYSAPGAWPELDMEVDSMSFPILAQGAQGPDVQVLQALLNKYGANPVLAVDGQFGPATLAAVKAYQTAHKLTADGVVKADTWASLVGTTGGGANATPIKAELDGKPVQAYAIDDTTYLNWACLKALGYEPQPLQGGGFNFVKQETPEEKAANLVVQAIEVLKSAN